MTTPAHLDMANKLTSSSRASFEPARLWCGSEDSYQHVLQASAKAEAMAMAYASGDRDEEDEPTLLTKVGDVGVIDVQGSLIQGRAGWMSFFGVVGYDDIRAALVEAAQDASMGSILLNISSGGGQVAGLTDLVDFLSEVRKVKAVHTYGDSMMASAAYWLGSNAEKVSISKTTAAGSIGVLIMHVERSKQLADNGIGVTVVRAGKYKAITNNVEPLSEDGRKQLQSQADDIYDEFVGYVAKARGVSVDVADRDMAQGRVFMGKRALEAKLVDSIGNFDAALASAQKVAERRLSRTANNGSNMRFGGSQASAVDHNKSTLTIGTAKMPSPTLTSEQLAALAAGATAEALGLKPEDLAAPAAAETVVEAPVEPPAAPAASAASEQVPTEAPAAPAASESEVVTFLRGELRQANADLGKVTAEAADLKAQAQANSQVLADMTAIVRGVVANMAVALGGNAAASETSDTATLLAEHARLSTAFKEKFKVGGVAAAPGTPKADTKPKAALVDPLFVTLAKSTADRNAK